MSCAPAVVQANPSAESAPEAEIDSKIDALFTQVSQLPPAELDRALFIIFDKAKTFRQERIHAEAQGFSLQAAAGFDDLSHPRQWE